MENKETQIAIVVKNSGLEVNEGQTLIEKFGNYEQIANEWKIKAQAIVVTNATQVTEMKMAKEARKYFSDLRNNLERERVAMKEQSLRKGQAIDAVAKFIVSLIRPIEEHLKLQEDFIKIQEEKKIEEERVVAEKKAEEERLAAIEAERKEQERVRLENEKLRKEAEAREIKMAEERKKAEAERLAVQKKLDLEKAKAEADRKAAEEARIAQEKIITEQKIEAERKQKELEDRLKHMIECPNCHHKFSISR